MIRMLAIVRAFLMRDLQTEMSYRLAFFLQLAGLFVSTTLWYFVTRVVQFGGVSKSQDLTGGIDYFAYVLAGLMISRFLDVSLHVYATSVQREQATGTLEAMLVTPTRLGSIVLASSTFSYLYALLQASLYLLFGLLLFGLKLNIGSLVGLFAAVVFTVVGMSGIGILSAAFVLYFKRGNPIDFFISTTSMLFGSVLIPPAALPEQVAWISQFVPTYHAAEAVRDVLLRGKGLSEIEGHLLALAGFAVVLVPLGLFTAKIAVRRAKREGTLVQY